MLGIVGHRTSPRGGRPAVAGCEHMHLAGAPWGGCMDRTGAEEWHPGRFRLFPFDGDHLDGIYMSDMARRRRCIGKGCDGWFDASEPAPGAGFEPFCDAARPAPRHGYLWDDRRKDWVLVSGL